jgi:hypothetical protein
MSLEDLIATENMRNRVDLYKQLETAYLSKQREYIYDNNNGDYSGGFIRFDRNDLISHWSSSKLV